MYILNREEAIEKMRMGQVIGFITIPGVQIYFSEGTFLFKHRNGDIEPLDFRTIADHDGYCLLPSEKPLPVKFNNVRRIYELK